MNRTQLKSIWSSISWYISEMRDGLSRIGVTAAQIGIVAACLIMLYIVSMCFAVWFIAEISANHNKELPQVRYEFTRE